MKLKFTKILIINTYDHFVHEKIRNKIGDFKVSGECLFMLRWVGLIIEKRCNVTRLVHFW